MGQKVDPNTRWSKVDPIIRDYVYLGPKVDPNIREYVHMGPKVDPTIRDYEYSCTKLDPTIREYITVDPNTISRPYFQKSLDPSEGKPLPNLPLCIFVCQPRL